MFKGGGLGSKELNEIIEVGICFTIHRENLEFELNKTEIKSASHLIVNFSYLSRK